MATYVEIRTDAFAEELQEFEQGKLDFSGVRRPLRGLEIKDDTYSILKVIRADGREIPLVDAGGSSKARAGNTTQAGSEIPGRVKRRGGTRTYNYSNFIIQRINESRQEKSQILETFGDSYIFFFGERPRVLQVEGLLFNTLDFNWRTEFWVNYEEVLRGSKLVEQNARVYLHWDDIVVEGYILQANAQDDSLMPYHIPFTFSMFVTNHLYLSAVGDDTYPLHNGVVIQPLNEQLTAAGAASLDANLQTNPRAAAAAIERGRLQSLIRQDQANKNNEFLTGKNMFLNAITLGLNAQATTFLSLANRFFRQRRMRFPRGIAGADAAAGSPSLATLPGPFQESRRRPNLRTQIRDNVDEYVQADAKAQFVDRDKIKQAQERQERLRTKPDLEKEALAILTQLGINPIQHGKPGELSPFDHAHSTTVTEGTIGSDTIATARNLGFTV